MITPHAYCRAPRIAFYTYPEWAFGAIHSALCKELYKHGIIANIIDWNHNFSPEERASFESLYDIFVTVPGNSVTLLRENFGVSYEKIIAIAHGRYDLEYGLSQGNDYNALRGFAGVSPDLHRHAQTLGISRKMDVVLNGIHFDYYYSPVSSSLASIGYGGAFRHHDFSGTVDIKRGYLAQEICSRLGLPFAPAQTQSYLTMPRYYNTVDAVMVCSTQESCALPLMEASATGRLPISTKVGVARDYQSYPGIILPMDESSYVEQGVEILRELMLDPEKHQKKCREVQDFARENYDWSKVIDTWLDVLK